MYCETVDRSIAGDPGHDEGDDFETPDAPASAGAITVADLHQQRRRQQEHALAIQVGARFAAARSTADLDVEEGARRLGLRKTKFLQMIEAGDRLPPVEILITAAERYGTTVDFLCGLSDEVDRDPAAGLMALVGAQVQRSLHEVARDCATANVAMLRSLMPSGPQALALADAVIELAAAVDRMREVSPVFDREIAGGSRVVYAVTAATSLACTVRDQVKAAQRRALQARKGSKETVQLGTDLLPVLRTDFMQRLWPDCSGARVIPEAARPLFDELRSRVA